MTVGATQKLCCVYVKSQIKYVIAGAKICQNYVVTCIASLVLIYYYVFM